MEYGYEKILQVQRRCGVSFEEADRALRYTKGDVDKACTYAIRKKSHESNWTKKTIDALKNFITYRIRIIKNGEIRLNIPMGVIIVIVFLYLIAVPQSYYYGNGLGLILLLVFAIVVITGHTFEITPSEKKQEEKLEKFTQKPMPEEEILETYAENEIEQQDDGYNTVEIK